MTRIIVISGKGGVGKTTIACATAVATADQGLRTLVVSLDRAHSLGDVLGTPLTFSAMPIADCPNLFAMEIDPQAELEQSGAAFSAYMERFLRYLGANGISASEMTVIPGLEELLVMTRLAELAESGEYDVIVSDMAPTASSIRYLSFPDMMEGILGKLLTWDQRISRVLRPLQGRPLKLPVPEEEVYASVRNMAERLSRLRSLLQDPERTSVRLVMVPESIVLEETRRAFTYLSLYGLNVDEVIVNRVIPETVGVEYFKGWRDVQARVLTKATESLTDLTLRKLEFQDEEVLSVSALRNAASELYKGSNPSAFVQRVSTVQFSKEGGTTRLTIRLLHAQGDRFDLRKHGDELIISVNGWRRRITLPDSLIGEDVVKAKLAGGFLAIQFSA